MCAVRVILTLQDHAVLNEMKGFSYCWCFCVASKKKTTPFYLNIYALIISYDINSGVNSRGVTVSLVLQRFTCWVESCDSSRHFWAFPTWANVHACLRFHLSGHLQITFISNSPSLKRISKIQDFYAIWDVYARSEGWIRRAPFHALRWRAWR